MLSAAVATTFNYDLQGNRETVTDTLNNVTRTYTPNVANEYTQIAANGVPQIPQGVDMYDVRGNLARDDGFDADPDDGFVYEYDPENRLTKVEYDDGTNPAVTMAEYRYDALGRRIEYRRYSDAGALLETIRYYYDGQNVVAEYTDNGTVEVLARQFYNGSQYIDERVAMRDYQTGPTARDHYYLHQELYSEAGLAAANGSLEEAYVYDTYGEAKIYQWPRGDFDRDGDVESAADDSGDNTTKGFDDDDADYLAANLSGSSTATDKPWLDLDGDGDADADDQGLLAVAAAPTTLAYSEVRNPYLFTGRTTDTWHANSMADTSFRRKQWNRNRYYDPGLGRWDEPDPIGYADGMNRHVYGRNNPVNASDPDGLLSNTCLWCGGSRMEQAPSQSPRGWAARDILDAAGPWTIGAAVGVNRCIYGTTPVRINGTQFYITGTPQAGMWLPKTGSSSYVFIYKASDPNKVYRLDYDTLKVGPSAGQLGWEHNQKGVAKILGLTVKNHQPAGAAGRVAGSTVKILRYAGKPLLVVGMAQSAASIGLAAYQGEDVKRVCRRAG